MMEQGFALWITGLPASGKSTLARALKKKLADYGINIQVLESDAVRKVLTPEPTYSSAERDRFYSSLLYIGKLLIDNGVNVIFDATANLRKYREMAKKAIPKFAEIYLDTPLEICMERDPKGIYKKGKDGRSSTVPGLQSTYEKPLNPEITLHGDKNSPDYMVEKILEMLSEKKFTPKIGCLKN